MLPERLHGLDGQPQHPPALRRLGIPGSPDAPVHRHRPGVQIHIRPQKRPQLLGPQPGQQRQNHIGLQRRPRRCIQQRPRLLQRQRP
jgi:hypothetical protein